MSKKCRFCESLDDVKRVKNRFFVCRACRPAVYAVIKSPDVIEQVWPLLQDRAILPQVRRIKIPWRVEIPEELPAKRHRTQDREQNTWYLIVSEHEKQPVELFMSTAGENDYRLQSKIANLTALTRLISLMLRHIFLGEEITIKKVQNQLQKSSRQSLDLPDMVLRILNKYSNTGILKNESPTG